MYTDRIANNEENKETTQDKRSEWEKPIECIQDIVDILGHRPALVRNGFWYTPANMITASYLLAKASEYNNPMGVGIDDLAASGVDPVIISFARSTNVADAWEDLIKLTEKYSKDIFNTVSTITIKGEDLNSTPDGIVELSKKILGIQSGESFADICCGTGSMAFSVKNDLAGVIVSGFDSNAGMIAVAKIGAETRETDISFSNKDVFSLALDNPNGNVKYDKLFANYPFGLRLNRLETGKKYKESIESRIPSISKATSSDWLFNLLLVDLLSDNGKAIGIMTNGSIWNMIDTPIRKYFVEKGLIECVIALPSKLFDVNGIATSLVVFSHGNKGVKLVDATTQFKAGRRINELTDDNVNNIINSIGNDGENSMFIPTDILRENDYVLNISRYLPSTFSIKNGFPFETIIKRITRGVPLNAKQLDTIASDVPTDKQYLMLSNIQNGIIDNNLPYLTEIDSKMERYCLTNHCLILSKNGYPYKVAVAEIKEGQKILANGNLYIIEIDEEQADPYYLAAFFSSELGTALLKNISVGATVPNIGVGQLEKLIIPLPPLEKQKEIAEKYQTAKDELALLQLKMEMARNRMTHAFEEE